MKKKFLLVILMIVSLFMPFAVYAEDDSETGEEAVVDFSQKNSEECTLETKTELRMEAANVNVSYQPVEILAQDDPDTPADQSGVVEYFFDVKIYNVNSNLKVVIKSGEDEGFEKVVTYKNIQQDGSITARKMVTNQLSNLIFEVHGSDSTGMCALETLRTIKLTLPKYNNLAEREVCTEVPEFYMCQKYISYNIDPSRFTAEINEYKEKLAEQQNGSDVEIEDNNTIPNRLADAVSDYKFIIVGAIVAAGILITVIILKRKKSVL